MFKKVLKVLYILGMIVHAGGFICCANFKELKESIDCLSEKFLNNPSLKIYYWISMVIAWVAAIIMWPFIVLLGLYWKLFAKPVNKN